LPDLGRAAGSFRRPGHLLGLSRSVYALPNPVPSCQAIVHLQLHAASCRSSSAFLSVAAAVRQLEAMRQTVAEESRGGRAATMPGLVVQIVNVRGEVTQTSARTRRCPSRSRASHRASAQEMDDDRPIYGRVRRTH
jgi:hypothetical protein